MHVLRHGEVVAIRTKACLPRIIATQERLAHLAMCEGTRDMVGGRRVLLALGGAV